MGIVEVNEEGLKKKRRRGLIVLGTDKNEIYMKLDQSRRLDKSREREPRLFVKASFFYLSVSEDSERI